MTSWLLGLELIHSAILPVLGIVTLALIAVVAAVKPRHPIRLAIGGVTGAVLAAAAVFVFDALDTFDGEIPTEAAVWAVVGLSCAGFGAAALWAAPWWRRVLAAILVLTSLMVGGLGVNAAFGITHTLAAIIGVSALDPVTIPARISAAPLASPQDAPLYENWSPPAGMPAHGVVGSLSGANRIPSPGYAPRDAALYLPPAALVADPPPLPLIVFMMGQPGSPDPTAIAAALDAFAAQHGGLAPIAIVADQLTRPTADPACHDSKTYGAVSTYFNREIPAFARARLNIIDDPAYWVIGGYSNGGSCAATWGSQHPRLWGQVLDVSGNEFPGSGSVASTIATVFGGDRSAFQAAKPAAVMAAHAGAYRGHTAVFTAGGDDKRYGPGQRRNAAAARAAGFTVTFETVPGAAHVGRALDEGLALGIAALGPVLRLAAP